jgi:hypothetical protein
MNVAKWEAICRSRLGSSGQSGLLNAEEWFGVMVAYSYRTIRRSIKHAGIGHDISYS